MSYINGAMAVASLYSGIKGGQVAKEQGAAQQQALNYQAGVEEANGLSMAAIIRRAGKRAVGAATAAYAGAGVKVGEGSAADTTDQIEQDVEHDAFQAILEGKRRGRAARMEGVNAATAGSMRQTADLVGGINSALSAFGRTASGWKTVNNQYNYNGDASGARFSLTGADVRARR